MQKGFDADVHLTDELVEQAIAAGDIGAGLYTKVVDANDIAIAARHRFGLWFIYEGMGDLETMEQGAARGQSDGARAAAVLKALGVPETVPIFAAADFGAIGSTQIADVDQYMSGFAQGCAPYPQGNYGDGDVITSLPNSPGYVAGADGWSGTEALLANLPAHVALIQHAPVDAFGISIDPCDIVNDKVLWFPAGAAQTTAPVVIPTAEQMQAALGVTVDGEWGPASQAALAAYYARQGA